MTAFSTEAEEQLEKAKNLLVKFDYEQSAACLIQASEFPVDQYSSLEIAVLSEQIRSLLNLTEPLHDGQIKAAQNATKFIIAPNKVTSMCRRMLETWRRKNSDPHIDLALAHTLYMQRELSDALQLLFPHKDYFKSNPFFWQLLATCHMLHDEPQEAQIAIDVAISLDPNDSENRRLIRRITLQQKHIATKRIESGRWIPTLLPSINLREACRKYILSDISPGLGWLTSNSRVATFGSCFAINIADALNKQGVNSHAFMLGEEINNTCVNLEIFKLIANKKYRLEVSAADKDSTLDWLITNEFLDHLSSFADKVSKADILIFTLGVSQGFFELNGRPLLVKGSGGVDRSVLARAKSRFIEVEENEKNVREIIEMVRRLNPKIKVVLTLSPVPLHRTFGNHSAVISDSISKSILRVAAHRVTSDKDLDVLYWPSFEIAKWIAPHVLMQTEEDHHFGADDHDSRHVSRRIIDMIIELFVEYLSPVSARN